MFFLFLLTSISSLCNIFFCWVSTALQRRFFFHFQHLYFWKITNLPRSGGIERRRKLRKRQNEKNNHLSQIVRVFVFHHFDFRYTDFSVLFIFNFFFRSSCVFFCFYVCSLGSFLFVCFFGENLAAGSSSGAQS